MTKQKTLPIEQTIPVIEIEFPDQLKSIQTKDYINTSKMLEMMFKGKINLDTSDELVISNDGEAIITMYRAKTNKIFQRRYKPLEDNKIIFNQFYISKANEEYPYLEKFEKEMKGGLK